MSTDLMIPPRKIIDVDIPDIPTNGVEEFEDSGAAAVFAEMVLVGRWVYCDEYGWFEWTGKIWKQYSKDTVIVSRAREWVAGNYADAAENAMQAVVDGQKNTAKAWEERQAKWRRLNTRSRIDNLVYLARGIVRVEADIFDRDPLLINCQNGIYDIRTDTLMPHNPAKYMTKIAGAEYTPGATSPDWKTALEALPDDIASYIQMRLGQALTGRVPENDKVMVMVGSGANGKSTLLNSCMQVGGDYAIALDPRALVSSSNAIPAEVMALRGVRMAVVEELPESGKHMDTARLKTLASGESPIAARALYGNPQNFRPSHTLFLTSNYRPTVSETDHGTWRRFELVIFPFTFGAQDQGDKVRKGDLGLRGRLSRGEDGQHEAVLAWLIEGARAWFVNGCEFPEAPQRIQADTLDWRHDSDVVLRFADERLELDPDSWITVADMLSEFNDFLENTLCMKKLSDRTFSQRAQDNSFFRDGKIEKKTIRAGKAGRSVSYSEFDGGQGSTSANVKAWHGVRFSKT